METVIAVERDGEGRHLARELRTGDLLAPRPLHSPPGGPLRLALVGTHAGLLAGDALALRVEVGPGARLELTEAAGLVAYDHRGGPASSWSAEVRLGEGAELCWPSRPFVVSDGAHVERRLTANLAEGARMRWRELLSLGRTGETGGAVRTLTRVSYAGAELLVEDLDLRDPGLRALPGVLGLGTGAGAVARCVGAVAAFGTVPLPSLPLPHLTRLAGPGALCRVSDTTAPPVENALDQAWDLLAGEARSGGAVPAHG
ncbi:urease accessory protein UreD [Streptomyces sp. NPDC048172]|uniref:urease accessory protein UreD n=1 Tax=Streptomyces sp. NPDC048172 TaxID=3365505 RepID=UPI003711730C